MEYRQLGASGPPVLSFGTGTGTFGGTGPLFGAWGRSETLDAASALLPPYPHTPYRQQEGFARLHPAMV